MSVSNLLTQTMQMIAESGKQLEDVAWVGDRRGTFAMEWNDAALVMDVEYNRGYGSAEIARDLVVVFKDSTWLERWEYDGREGWRYCTPPTTGPSSRSFSCVKTADGVYEDFLEQMQPGYVGDW